MKAEERRGHTTWRATRFIEWVIAIGTLALFVLALVLAADTVSAASRRCFGHRHNGPATNGQANFLIGRNGRDVFRLKGGDDTALGLGGADRLCGGRGDDTLDGGEGYDRLDGGPGYDVCKDAEVYRRCEEFRG